MRKLLLNMALPESKSRLQLAIETPVDALTEEQKVLLRESQAALTDEQKETFASVLEEKE